MGNIVSLNPLYMQAVSSAAGTVIALFILWGIFRIINKFLTKILELGEKFIVAQQAQAASQGAQAQTMATLTAALQESTGKDNSEHREIILTLSMIAKDVRRLGRTTDNKESSDDK